MRAICARPYKKAKAAAADGGGGAEAGAVGAAAGAGAGTRDHGLSVFHALGKILYNKRGAAAVAAANAAAAVGAEEMTLFMGDDKNNANAAIDLTGGGGSGGGGGNRGGPVSASGRGIDGLTRFGDGVAAPPLHPSLRREPTAVTDPEAGSGRKFSPRQTMPIK